MPESSHFLSTFETSHLDTDVPPKPRSRVIHMSLPLLQNFINGKFIPAATDATFDVVDPRTEQVVAQCPVSGSADVDAAYDAALKAFESWRLTTPAERQMLLLRLADALEANADRLVEAQRRNTGQLAEMIRAEEVVTGASQLRFFAGAARLQSGVASGEYAEGLNSQIRREPIDRKSVV